MRELRDKYANVFFIGQNGGYVSSADLIKQLRAMINYSRCSRYIVISHHVPNSIEPTIADMKVMEDSLAAEFGSNYINLRIYMVEHALQDANLEPTQADRDSIATSANNGGWLPFHQDGLQTFR